MKYSEETPSRSNNFHPRLFCKLQWFAIPMTAKRFCKLICVAILPAAKPLAIAAAVLQQKHSSLESANSRHLSKRSDRVGKRTRRKRRHYCVKTVGPKRKSLCIR